MKGIEGFYFHKWTINNNKLFKKLKDSLVGHPDLSLRMNHVEWIKWMNLIPFILFNNF